MQLLQSAGKIGIGFPMIGRERSIFEQIAERFFGTQRKFAPCKDKQTVVRFALGVTLKSTGGNSGPFSILVLSVKYCNVVTPTCNVNFNRRVNFVTFFLFRLVTVF